MMHDDPPKPYVANAIHLARTTQQITMQLSQMADQKASILMGATFVVFTISIGQARAGTIGVSLSILATFAFLSAMFAVSAVLPRIGTPPPPAPGTEDRSNILFFGRFAQMGEDEYIDAVKARLRSDDTLYETMLRDTYQNGVMLARRKYRLLAIAYRLFIVGLSLTFVAFAVEMALHWRA